MNFTSNGIPTQVQLKEGRTSLAAVNVQQYVIFAGGQTDLNTLELSDTIDIYNALTHTWYITNQTLSVARTRISATSVGNLAFFAGGCTDLENNTWTNIVDIYNAAKNNWTTRALSSNIVAATSIRDVALFAGQFKMDIFNFSTQSWQTINTTFNATGLALSSGDLTFFTGIGFLYIYNVINKQWTNASLPGLGPYTGTVLQNRLLLSDADYTSQVYVFDFSLMQWESPLAISTPRGGMAVTTVHVAAEKIALFAGGSDSNGPVSAIDEYFYCFAESRYLQCPSNSTSSNNPSQFLPEIILAIASFVIAVLLLFIFVKWRREKKRGGYYPLVNVKSNASRLEDVQVKELIGSGQFSEVYKGIWK